MNVATRFVTLALTLLLPAAVVAHAPGAAGESGFVVGFVHPLAGLDHLLAMLAVGMWGAQLGNPALWALPVAFPLIMAAGATAGIVGLALPGVETIIVGSVVVLGALIAADQRPRWHWALIAVAVFAIAHGHAHGTELPAHTGAAAYSMGFVLATGLIHLAGIAIGCVTELPRGLLLLRGGGGAIALAGLALSVGLL